VLRYTWTSFFKARLNCSLPGEFPFYFDEIRKFFYAHLHGSIICDMLVTVISCGVWTVPSKVMMALGFKM